jgi:hypothetical protein
MPSLSGAGTPAADHLSVVYWADRVDRIFEMVVQRVGVLSGEFEYRSDLPPAVKRLVKEQLLPLALSTRDARQTHRYFEALGGAAAARSSTILSGFTGGPTLHPFLMTPQGHVLAGWYERSDTAECWILPAGLEDLASWVEAALDHLHDRDPARYPHRPGWGNERRWRTTEERRLLAELRAVGSERDALLASLGAREQTLRAELSAAKGAAEGYERCMLTLQGDELADVVS